jgi:hypothetical protein
MTDPPKGKSQRKPFTKNENTRTHQKTETPISAPEFKTKMLYWITNRKYKITSSPAASEEVRNGKDQASA